MLVQYREKRFSVIAAARVIYADKRPALRIHSFLQILSILKWLF